MRNRADSIIDFYNTYVMKTYAWNPIVVVKGRGSWVWDINGKKYLDFFPGWAVSGLGHCNAEVVRAIKRQAAELIHMPNNFMTGLQPVLAKKIVEHAFKGKCFFCNSGAEANETAFKIARKYGSKTGRYEIITMKKSFHGRTLAAVTATGQEKYHKGFEPLVPGFKYAEFGSKDDLEKAITDKTVAVMLEPIQGEGGINVSGRDYLKYIKDLCDKRDILLILDEIQTGMGRTGRMFAYQHYGVEPDIMTLAKTLGGGIP
ncbi:MAG: aminotransferase class III-fold pyridoxal phosphate-dependent enzyme, partial [bacterium]|nr:aminotransferase class III-fold pyridoxal phosphate-dependent enzyme [bacterium]